MFTQFSVEFSACFMLRKALFHPKDKVEKEFTCCAMYEIPWHNCELKYIGELGRKFNMRLSEHQKDAINELKYR